VKLKRAGHDARKLRRAPALCFFLAQEVHWQNKKIPSFLRRDFEAEALEFLNPRLNFF